jgi:hypothetical protein
VSPSILAIPLQSRGPAGGTRWQHGNGNQYTVLLVSNEDSTRPEEYPPTVVYQGDDGKIWSRPVSRWYGSMTALPKAADAPGELAGVPEVQLTEYLAKFGPQMQTSIARHRNCDYCNGAEAMTGMKWRLYRTQQALRAQLLGAQDLQNELVGRAQTPAGNDPMLSFDSSMSRDEVANQFRQLVERVRARPAKEANVVVFEWLSAMWGAVWHLEKLESGPADRQAAARGLRALLENEVAAPVCRQAVAAQLRSPEDADDAPWSDLPLADVARAEANGYEVRYLFDHAEGAPAVGILHKDAESIRYQLANSAANMQDGVYALHAMRLSDFGASQLEATAMGEQSHHIST